MAANAVPNRLRTGPTLLPEVWEELLPYLALGWAPAKTSGSQAMCGMHALTESLNAQRIMNERLDPEVIHFSYNQIRAILEGADYEARVQEIVAPIVDPAAQGLAYTELMDKDWLSNERIGLLLEMINAHLNTNYRLGIIVAAQHIGQPDYEAPRAYLYKRPTGGGPVIWLYSYGNGTHWEAIVPDQPLTARPNCDYIEWGFEGRVKGLVEAGLYRVTTHVVPVGKADATGQVPQQMALEPGQFVTMQRVPNTENWIAPSTDWFWGRLPSLRKLDADGKQAVDVPMEGRQGPVHMSTVIKVNAVVRQGHLTGINFPKSKPGDSKKKDTKERGKKAKKDKSGRKPGKQKGFLPSKTKNKDEIKKGTKIMKRGGDKERRLTLASSASSASSKEEPVWKRGNPDPTRRQPSFSDNPGTLRMYFATTPQPISDPTSRLLNCTRNQLLLKIDHEELEFPRMREIDLLEGYIALENLERIRRPWGIQNIMPTKGYPDFDSMRYSELKLVAKRNGVRPGCSTRAAKRNILSDKREKDMEKATDRQDLKIYKLRPTYRKPRQGYDAALMNSTHQCRYVLKTLDNGDGTWVITNIDGYSATVAEEMLLEEPEHWGISVVAGTTFPQPVNPNSPEPIFVPTDTTTEEGSTIANDDGGGGGDNGGGEGYSDGDQKPNINHKKGKFESQTVIGQCGIGGVAGALIALRNALQNVNLEIRCVLPKDDDDQAVALAAQLERYILEASMWVTEMEQRSSKMGSGVPAPEIPGPPTINKRTRSSLQRFLYRLPGPLALIGATLGVCSLARSIKGTYASTFPSPSIVRSDFIPMLDYPSGLTPIIKMGSNLGQSLVAISGSSPFRKRAFDETELKTEGQPLARRSKF